MKIKKGWKITWIALGSLLGLAVVTVAVALWLVFTPSQLTKIVNSLAGKFITCEARFGRVDLTLISTFPDAGLRIDSVMIVNPMAGAPSDTVAYVGSLTVGIDVKAYLKEKKIVVHQVLLDDAQASLYVAKDGSANYDIFPKSESADTSSSELPELIDLKKIKLSNLQARFVDEKDGMSGEVAGMDLKMKGAMEKDDIDADLKLEVQKLFFSQGGEQPRMVAAVDGLETKIEGKKAGDRIDAEVTLGGLSLDFEQKDSVGNSTLKAKLADWKADLDADGTLELLDGRLKLKVENGKVAVSGSEMVNEMLQKSSKDLLTLDMPFKTDLNQMKIMLGESELKIDDYALELAGTAQLAHDTQPLTVDLKLNTDGAWQVAPLLAIVPDAYAGFKRGMDVDGKVTLEATAVGSVTDSTMPLVDAHIGLKNGQFHYPSALPYRIKKIDGDVSAHLDLGAKGVSSAKINSLTAQAQGTKLSVSGRADDLLGDMRVDAKVKGSLPLEDVKPLLPKGMDLQLAGNADVDVAAAFRMSELQRMAFDKMKASGMLKMKDLDVDYDSMHADTKKLDIALQIPAKEKDKMADVQLATGKLNVENGKKMKVDLENATIKVGVNNMMKEQLAAAFDIEVGETDAKMDSTIVLLSELKLGGSVKLDSTKQNMLKQYNPRLNVAVDNVLLYTPMMPENVRVTEFNMSYTPALLDIRTAKVKLGHSDFELYGEVENIEDWLDKKAMLKGDLNFTSNYADVDQLMNMFSGMGSDADSLEAMRKEDSVPAEANPFIVPRDVNVTLHTHVKRSIAFGNDLHDVAGALTVNDGRVVLDQMGFVCKAATMQLTALYRSPRPGNLFAAIDFHLLDIQIDELLDMIPAVDTLVPMLSAFDGNANFHLAGESYLDAYYRPKMPSLKGAAAISGKDLVVMDNNDLATIAKLMRFKSWKDKDNKIKIDSLSVEMTCMDEGHGSEIEILPFLLSMGSYQICISGVQGVNMDCSYHLELLKNPLLAKVGVDVKGSLKSPKISLGKVRYADLFRPKYQGVAEKKALEIKNKVRQALEANVR